MLFVCSWLWGNKWDHVFAERLFNGINRNLKQKHMEILITDRITDTNADGALVVNDQLMDRPGCLPRMRMFDRGLQERMGATKGDRIVNIDIDAVITGPLDDLLNDDCEFRIMQGHNSTNPCPYNGSLWSFRAGERHDVWDDFSWDAVQKIPRHAIPDDQGWLHHKFPNAAAYTPADGVHAFKKKLWTTGHYMPKGARVVAFPGRSPAKYEQLPWVKEHWTA